jgi:CHAT domain-containing protein
MKLPGGASGSYRARFAATIAIAAMLAGLPIGIVRAQAADASPTPADVDAQAIAAYDQGHYARASALLAAIPAPTAARALARRLNLAAIFELAAGDGGKALADLDQATSLLAAVPNASVADRLALLGNRAVVLGRLGRYREAKAALDDFQARYTAATIADAPEAIAALGNAAVAAWRAGDIEAPGPIFAQLADRLRATPSPPPALLAATLANQAGVAIATLQPALAIDAAKQAHALDLGLRGETAAGSLRTMVLEAQASSAGTGWADYREAASRVSAAFNLAREHRDASDPTRYSLDIFAYLPLLDPRADFPQLLDLIDGADRAFYLDRNRMIHPSFATPGEEVAFNRDMIALARQLGNGITVQLDAYSIAKALADAGDSAGALPWARMSLDRLIDRFDFKAIDDTPYRLYLDLLEKTGQAPAADALRQRRQRADTVLAAADRIEQDFYRERSGPADNLALVDKPLALLADYPGPQSYRYGNALDYKAIFLSEAGRPEEAIATLEQSIAITRAVLGPLDDDMVRQLRFYAQLLTQSGRTAEARTVLAEAIRGESMRRDHSRDTVSLYIQALTDSGQSDTAVAWADRQIAQYDRESALIASKKRHNAELAAQGGVGDIVMGNDNSTEELFDKAGVLLAMDRYGEAETIGREIVRRRAAIGRIDYESYRGHNVLGLALLGRADHPAAEREFAAARKVLDGLKAVEPLAYDENALLLARTRLAIPEHRGSALDMLAPLVDHARNSRLGRVQAIGGSAAAASSGLRQADLFALYADALWARDPGSPASSGLAFAAIQESMANPASRAVAQAAARAAAERHGPDLGALAREREELVAIWRDIDQKFAAVVGGNDQQAEAERARLIAAKATLEQRFAAIDDRLRVDAPEYHALVQPEALSVAQTQALLGPDEAALIVLPTDYGTHLIAVTRDALQWNRSALTAPQVRKMVERLRSDLDPSPKTDPVAAKQQRWAYDRGTAFALYQQLIAPILPTIQGRKQLFVAADGALASLPFGVLVTRAPQGDDADMAAMRATGWFEDDFALVQIPSLQSLQFLRSLPKRPAANRAGPVSFIGFGDPALADSAMLRGLGTTASSRIGRGISPSALAGIGLSRDGSGLADVSRIRELPSLPGTRTELENLRAALGAPESALHLGTDANEARVRSMPLAGDRIIAFATHGVTAGELQGIAEPGLILSPPAEATADDDGYLSASEITALRLDADWVILSACNTAAGDGKGTPGLSGLARAFFYAGARNLLASHWPVFDDIAARITADAIQRQQADPSLTRAQALQRATQAIRNTADDSSTAHPAAWGPFTLVGDGE